MSGQLSYDASFVETLEKRPFCSQAYERQLLRCYAVSSHTCSGPGRVYAMSTHTHVQFQVGSMLCQLTHMFSYRQGPCYVNSHTCSVTGRVQFQVGSMLLSRGLGCLGRTSSSVYKYFLHLVAGMKLFSMSRHMIHRSTEISRAIIRSLWKLCVVLHNWVIGSFG